MVVHSVRRRLCPRAHIRLTTARQPIHLAKVIIRPVSFTRARRFTIRNSARRHITIVLPPTIHSRASTRSHPRRSHTSAEADLAEAFMPALQPRISQAAAAVGDFMVAEAEMADIR